MSARTVLALSLLAACSRRAPSRADGAPTVTAPHAVDDASSPRDASDGIAPDAGRASLSDSVSSVFIAADPHERWAVLCQAREDTNRDGELVAWTRGFSGELEGDAMRPYLFARGSFATPIEDFVAASPTGDAMVCVRDQRLRLLDARTSREVELRADPTGDADTLQPHGAATFSPDGALMLYVRSRGARATLVLRAMADGAEREFSAGEGLFVRASLPSSRWARIEAVLRDTNASGAIEPPGIESNIPPRRCRPSSVVIYVSRVTGDAAVQRWFSTETLQPVDAENVVTTLGDRLIGARNGALTEFRAGAAPRELARASCGARVLARDEPSGRLLLACMRPRGAAVRAELLDERGRTALPFVIGRPGERHPIRERFYFFETPRGAAVYDLRSGALSPLQGALVDSDGAQALLEIDGRYALFSADSQTVVRFPVRREPPDVARWTARHLLLPQVVVDRATLRVVGANSAAVVTVSASHRALIATREQGQVFYGPLRWSTLPAFVQRAPAE
ncbi:MAG: hypothetical protein U0269_35495 [Polyangiales bacterium]